MPHIKIEILSGLRNELIRNRDKGELVIDLSEVYPSPGICASGNVFYKLSEIFFCLIS